MVAKSELETLRETVANVSDAIAEHCAKVGDADYPRDLPLDACVRRLVAECDALRTAAGPSGARFDPSNHHNALACSYCNPNGLELKEKTDVR